MLRSKRLGRSTIQPCATATRKRFPRPLRNRQLESGSRFRYDGSSLNRSGLAKPFRPYSLAPPQLESGSRVRYETGNSKAVPASATMSRPVIVADWRSHFDHTALRNRNSKAVPASATMSRPVIVADWRSHFDRTALRHRNSKAVPASATKQATRKRFPLPLR